MTDADVEPAEGSDVSDPPERRLILEVRFGSRDGEKTVLDPGRAIRVGRSERADLVFAADQQLSALHFSIAWDGAAATVKDLGSVHGTSLNGERVTQAKVESGSWIRAGDTILSVHVEAWTPPRISGPRRGAWDEDAHVKRQQRMRARDTLVDTPHLFAIVDASRDGRVLELLRESVERTRCLYEGTRGQALAEVGPHLVRLPQRSRLTDALAMEGWGRGWAIYFVTRTPFAEVRTHLRRFLRVEREKTGEPMLFRYYDPEVLRVFLPTASVRQRAEIFGPIEAFLVEAEDGEILRFSPGSVSAHVHG